MMSKKIPNCSNLYWSTCVEVLVTDQKLISNSNPEKSKVSGPVGVYVSDNNAKLSFDLSKPLGQWLPKWIHVFLANLYTGVI